MKKITDFLKHAGIPFYLGAGAALAAFIGMIMLIVTNGVNGYALESGGATITLGVFTVLLAAASAACSAKFGGQHPISAVVRLAALVSGTAVAGLLLLSRVMLYSALVSWDEFNTVGWEAFNTALAGIILFAVAAVALIVSAFFNRRKNV